MRQRHYIALGMVVITLVVFWQVTAHDFVGMDDDVHVYDNPYMNPVTLENILHFWKGPYEGLYVPLTYTVWAIQAKFAIVSSADNLQAAFNPHIFHITNLILHLLNTLLVFLILRILVRNDWASCVGAMLFALHPVQVEPVAWISALKDTLSGFFSLVAIWQYLSYALLSAASSSITTTNDTRMKNAKSQKDVINQMTSRRKQLHYSLATVAFMLALLSKPVAVIVPIIALMFDYWVVGRSFRESARALAGWAMLTVPIIILIKMEQPETLLGSRFIPSWWQRPFLVGDTFTWYLYKLFLPISLGVDYGRTPGFIFDNVWVYVTPLIPFGLAAFVWIKRKQLPLLFLSVGVYFIAILPVSGLTLFPQQIISTGPDRYTYFAMLGPAIALAAYLSQHRGTRYAILFTLLIGLLGIRSALQTRHWQNSITLGKHALQINPNSFVAHKMLGFAFLTEKRYTEGISHYYKALDLIDPKYSIVFHIHWNLGFALSKKGQLDAAIEHFYKALLYRPRDASVHYNLGIALRRQGKPKQAIRHYLEALSVNPNDAVTHNMLGIALASRGELDQAVSHFSEALRIQPHKADYHYNMAITLQRQGKLEKAAGYYSQALKIKPDHTEALRALHRVQTALGQRKSK